MSRDRVEVDRGAVAHAASWYLSAIGETSYKDSRMGRLLLNTIVALKRGNDKFKVTDQQLKATSGFLGSF